MTIPAQFFGILIAGFALCGAVVSLCYAWARNRWPIMTLYACISILLCFFAISCYGAQAAATPDAAYLPIRLKECFGNLLLLCLPFLYRALCGQRPSWQECLSTGFFLTLVSLALLRNAGFEWDHIDRMTYNQTNGVYYPHGEPGPFLMVVRFGQLLFTIHCIWIALYGWRAGHNGLWTVIAFPIALVSALLYIMGGILQFWAVTFELGAWAGIMIYLCLGAGIFQMERVILSERATLFASLKEREEKLTALTSAGRSLSCLLDVESRVVFANRAATQIVGGSAPRMLGTLFADLPWWGATELSETVRTAIIQVRTGVPARLETTRVMGDGSVLNLEFSLSPYHDANGHLCYIIAEGRDITERKLAEQSLHSSHQRLQLLTAHLHSVREEERARVASEVQEDLGQALTGLKLQLSWLKRHTTQSKEAYSTESLLEKMESMNDLIETTIKSVRRIATELRPPILDTFGLIPALEWLTQDFQNRSGIRCSFVSSLESTSLDPQRATAVFRIAQESLTNVARHARASSVEVGIESRDGSLVLTVSDNGVGIEPSALMSRKAFGLLGMQERAQLSGGEIAIERATWRGTSVRLTMAECSQSKEPVYSFAGDLWRSDQSIRLG